MATNSAYLKYPLFSTNLSGSLSSSSTAILTFLRVTEQAIGDVQKKKKKMFRKIKAIEITMKRIEKGK